MDANQKPLNNPVTFNVYMAYLEKNKPTLDRYAREIVEGTFWLPPDKSLVDSLAHAITAYMVWRANEYAAKNQR